MSRENLTYLEFIVWNTIHASVNLHLRDRLEYFCLDTIQCIYFNSFRNHILYLLRKLSALLVICAIDKNQFVSDIFNHSIG